MFTYGDGVADIDLHALLQFHKAHGKLARVTRAVRPPARFGRMAFEDDLVTEFYEKPEEGEGWISGGFFVLNAKVLNYIDGDQTVWEREPVEHLTREGQMAGYLHRGFWSCMDTLKEKNMLEDSGNPTKRPGRYGIRIRRESAPSEHRAQGEGGDTMKVLVTGIDGYIGAQLSAVLVERGHNVTGLDTGFYRDGWLYSDENKRSQSCISKDIRRIVEDDLRGFDAIVHLAELSNDPLRDGAS